MGLGERCTKCGHVVPSTVKQRCIADGGYCDIASSSSPSKSAARRAPARARARKPAKKKARRK